jgi:hypothetical protein
MAINVYWSPHKVPIILVRFKLIFNFLHIFLNSAHISNFTKIHPLGAELFYANGRTDKHDEANSRFSQYYGSA